MLLHTARNELINSASGADLPPAPVRPKVGAAATATQTDVDDSRPEESPLGDPHPVIDRGPKAGPAASPGRHYEC